MREQLITLSYIMNGDVHKMYKFINEEHNPIYINKKFLEQLKKLNIKAVTIVDHDYPKPLKQLPFPPLVLYYRGNLAVVEEQCYGVIGSRNATPYGKKVTALIIKHLVDNNICVVSGLAKGIDGLSHFYAKSYQGKTIGVIGSGFNHFYPKENEKLAEQLDLILTEYPPDMLPLKHHFPMRNRIVAALSNKLVIVEAKLKSGTMITCEIANELGKEIYCVPGSILHEYSEGCHQLISEGANILINVNSL